LATWSAAILPEAPGLFSMMTGCPRARDSGSAKVRAAMSGVEPPGKPTRMRTGFVGQPPLPESFFKLSCAVAQVVPAPTAIKIIAIASLRGSVCPVSFFMRFTVVNSSAYSVSKSFVKAKRRQYKRAASEADKVHG
jgi:hypothetical protein